MTLEVDGYSVTLSYPGMGSDQRSWGTGAQPCGSSSAHSGPSASPTEIPQVRVPAAIPTEIPRTKRHSAVHLLR
jgi:hypothetical protein